MSNGDPPKVSCECGKNVTCQCVPSFDPFNRIDGCTPTFGGCTCDCHRYPNVYHCAPCCYPGKGDDLLSQDIFDVVDSVKLTGHVPDSVKGSKK